MENVVETNLQLKIVFFLLCVNIYIYCQKREPFIIRKHVLTGESTVTIDGHLVMCCGAYGNVHNSVLCKNTQDTHAYLAGHLAMFVARNFATISKTKPRHLLKLLT
jgi:hypothetical protein